MSIEPVTPSSTEHKQASNGHKPSESVLQESVDVDDTRPVRIQFSFLRWATAGVIRVLYRFWTRVAARLASENSVGERLALALHIPLPDKLNMSWVNKHLAVGGRVRLEDIKTLKRAGITHIVDTRSEYCDDEEALAKEEITLLYLPTRDTHPLSIDQLMKGARWINEQIEHGGRVLIHCEHGVGRSVLLTCAALVQGGMSGQASLQLVKQRRWQAGPNQRQVARLREFESACMSLRRT